MGELSEPITAVTLYGLLPSLCTPTTTLICGVGRNKSRQRRPASLSSGGRRAGTKTAAYLVTGGEALHAVVREEVAGGYLAGRWQVGQGV